MKIVQSLWMAPSKGAAIEESRVKGGWLSEKYHHYSMALSACLLRQWYPELELVTDQAGAELLIDQLQLPYSGVNVCLDQLNQFPEGLWSLPKLHAYSLQQSPFLHVDGDVFTWTPFKTEQLGNNFLLVQSPEVDHHESYEKPLLHFQATLEGLPACMLPAATQAPLITSLNAGVLGGSDLEFINTYATQALELIELNKERLAGDLLAGFSNTIIEQYFFKQLAESQGKKIQYLFDKLSKNFEEILHFDQVPVTTKYIHVLGNAKQTYYNCVQVENRLRYHFPAVYKRVNKFHAQQGLFQEPSLLSPEGNTQAPIYQVAWSSPAPDSVLPGLIESSTDLVLIPGNRLQWNETNTQHPIPEERQTLTVTAPDSLNLEALSATIAELTGFGFPHAKEVYRFMAEATTKDILQTSFTLAPSAAIIEVPVSSVLHRSFSGTFSDEDLAPEDSILAILTKLDTSGIFMQPLVNWEQLLTYFQGEVLRGIDLMQIIDDNNPGEIPPIHIESLVFGFLCFHLVHTGNLCIADAPPVTSTEDIIALHTHSISL
ncbi:DUF6734 family protein [Hymenobacter elongatus]|uniref:DUF6734 domain-containing protein n=1 Tax=Hymenobacter elongatus TaxID=877208 RepID=A0A4Z0PGQ2_9BACT|nr:DUF6734 family protein [Hymenobacter elongatus]TGE13966.1 hypothetical protein E5J99_18025 [Hymenobacter elongatus]